MRLLLVRGGLLRLPEGADGFRLVEVVELLYGSPHVHISCCGASSPLCSEWPA